MMLAAPQLGAKATPLSLRQSRPARGFVCLAAKSNSSKQEAAVGRRNFLAALGLITAFTAAKGAQAAADPYEELKSITASRTGVSDSLLESYEKTRAAVSAAKSDRGIRERLAAEAANAPKAAPASSSSSGGLKLGGFGASSSPKPAAAPKPAAPSLFASKPVPKAPAPKPAAAAAPKPAAAPAAAAAGVGPVGGIAEALGVLGLVGVGASAVTNFVTSNSKGKAKKAKATPAAPAAAAAPSSSGSTRKAAAAGTGKVTAGTGKVQTGTGKTKVAAAAPARAAASSSTAKVVKKVPAKAGAAAAASAGTVKGAIKQALVNEEKPEEPTDFAVAGFLGFAGLLAAFFLFGLPEPVTVTPEGSKTTDPLVEEAKQAITATAPTYTTPLFKSLSDTESEEQRKVIIASKSAPEVAAPRPAPGATLPKPAAVAPPPAEAPKPAPAVPAVPAVPAPAPAKSVEEAKPAPVQAEAAAPAADQTASSPNNLLIVGGGIALIVAAFAAVGGGNSESSTAATGGAATATTTPPADTADGSSSKAESPAAAVAETVTAAASTAAAAAPPAPGAPAADNAAYEKAVNALFADPDTADELYAIIAPALRNGPALAWALVSNGTNAETLDGWAFQKLSSAKYKRVRQLLVDMGLDLPETPKPQPTLTAFGDSSAGVPLDPEKLRSVFEALLANPASRTLMRKLLAGAGMPFNEAAFEEQIKDSTYFNLAIAPILRKMPPQKLAVLADLQDPAKLQELVNSVSSLAADNTQLDAVTAELSGDVRNTVEKIREDSRETESSAAGSR